MADFPFYVPDNPEPFCTLRVSSQANQAEYNRHGFSGNTGGFERIRLIWGAGAES
jgi:hypothetical protein